MLRTDISVNEVSRTKTSSTRRSLELDKASFVYDTMFARAG
jgi:hypothetical protein